MLVCYNSFGKLFISLAKGESFVKRFLAILLSLCLVLSCLSSALAETVKVPIDFNAMSIDDLLALDSILHTEIENRGAGNGAQIDVAEVPAETPDTELAEGVETMQEGETEINDESFLLDLAAGLMARWEIAGQDTSLMSDKKLIEFMQRCINSELVFLAKYTEYEFVDPILGEYAHAYINALQSQFIGMTEYYGKDDDLYYQYYTVNGYYARTRYIYLINKSYGIDLPSKYSSTMKEMLGIGLVFNIAVPVTNALEAELYASELTFDTSSSSKYLYVSPFNIKNTAQTDIPNLTVKINFLNEKDVIVDSAYLVSYENVAKGKAVSTSKVSTDDHFTHISYSYSFNVQTDMYYETFEGTVVPAIQYSWDGTVKKNGQLADGQPVLELQNLYSGWEMNTSWSKTLYVPVLKFDVRNTGTGEAERVVVKVVFTNEETKQIWDEETTYVVGSSDTPLKVGFSKKAFVYSSVGYKTSTDAKPNLTADIYINDELVMTITVNK